MLAPGASGVRGSQPLTPSRRGATKTNPADVKVVQQSLAWVERGVFTQQETIDRLGFLLTGDDLKGVFETVAPEHHPLIQAGHQAALQRRADEDCLQPERSPFDHIFYEYHGRVAEWLLSTALGGHRRAEFTAVCLPSFQPEWAMRLFRPLKGIPDIREPTLLLVRAKEAIRGPTTGTIETTRYTLPIPDALATRLEAVWRMMLESTRAHRLVGTGLDGVKYHFVYRDRAAQTWSPRPESRAGRFVELAHTLARLTSAESSDRPQIEAELNDQLSGFGV